jgi:hypothetical protein
MRIWALLAVAAALAGALLTYRIAKLESRVNALSKQLGAPQATKPFAFDHGVGATAAGLEQRLSALEDRLQGLDGDLRSLEQDDLGQGKNKEGSDKASAEEHILSVVGRAQERIRDRQLQFHRARWLEWREAALDDFSERFGLSPRQNDQLHQLLSDEVDGMVEILRRPDALENPEKAARDWLSKLEQTDSAAHRVLEPSQVGAWDQAREAERKTLWPWLPSK